ncbi:hypothetical protein NPS70_16320 [Streptomyces sp. C10-9-1]|uniref:hypothetical protein n=1 Tax=Streptomyces sp. C10-9-1 TaxID=1859285 RepID=UPI002112D7DB|nr:hypothetical protein [Streptomyces sp. C10-9-1]MCQ6554751.1 hypothetical protein [Streptomyces sp. C10-9-1]
MSTSDMETRCAPYRSKLKPEPYATIVPSRRPEVKYHAGLGRAKSAVGFTNGQARDASGRWHSPVRGGEIYERTADGWELLYRVESGTPASELPWRDDE